MINEFSFVFIAVATFLLICLMYRSLQITLEALIRILKKKSEEEDAADWWKDVED